MAFGLAAGTERSMVGFAVRVTHAPRKTRFRPLVRRYRTGFPPAGFQRKVSELFPYISFSFPKLGLTQAGWPWRLPARAPTDPYVRTLAHTVPLMLDSPYS